MHLIGTLIIGLIVGALARLLMPGRDPMGCLVTMALGLVGSFIGTFLGQSIGWYRPGQSAGFIASIIGAMIVLAIYHWASRKG